VSRDRIAFIVPAFNERASLPGVVSDLRAHYPTAEIIVVNDGSTDDTAEVAESLGVTVLSLPFNLGIGSAVQTGLLYASRSDAEVAVQFDGDGQHFAGEVAKIIEPLRRGEADAVIGSRFVSGSSYRPPLMRRVGIGIFSWVNSLLVRRRLTDNTSGFRAYNRKAMEFLAVDYPHDYPEPESVVTLIRSGFRLVEVPVQMRVRAAGRSSITLLRSIYYMAKVLTATLIGATRSVQRRSP
jgi:glycosyltransferase involved in cell wall biosynthesis